MTKLLDIVRKLFFVKRGIIKNLDAKIVGPLW